MATTNRLLDLYEDIKLKKTQIIRFKLMTVEEFNKLELGKLLYCKTPLGKCRKRPSGYTPGKVWVRFPDYDSSESRSLRIYEQEKKKHYEEINKKIEKKKREKSALYDFERSISKFKRILSSVEEREKQ